MDSSFIHAISEDSDQTELMPSRGVARGFIMLKPTKIWRVKNIDFSFQIANNKGADQTAQMRRLVCAFAVRLYLA